jgi:SAM-dependent methyltransferase
MTKPRAFFEQTLLPRFATLFNATDTVLNIGAGRHAYRETFHCRVLTADQSPGCDETFAAEAIPYGADWFAGGLMMGVFERLDDPMQAMRELRRVVRPGGYLLISLLDLAFPWRKAVDRWRVSPGGVAHVVRAFTVLESHQVDDLAHFVLLQKPGGQP